MEDVEIVATVALSLVPGIGSRRLRQLVSTFGSAQAALDAPQSRLAATDGIGRGAATAIKAASVADGARVLETLAGLGARLLLPGEPEFPPQLEEIPDPPAVLFVWGDVAPPTQPGVALVGGRHPTPHRAAAARL